jgi:hypothetical protein
MKDQVAYFAAQHRAAVQQHDILNAYAEEESPMSEAQATAHLIDLVNLLHERVELQSQILHEHLCSLHQLGMPGSLAKSTITTVG